MQSEGSSSAVFIEFNDSRINSEIIVKLRQGSGKDWQGMAVKAQGLKALTLA